VSSQQWQRDNAARLILGNGRIVVRVLRRGVRPWRERADLRAYQLAGVARLGPTAVGYGRWPQCPTGIRAGRLIGERLDEANGFDEGPMPAQQLIEVP
jgi:hypothetical protein